MARVLIVGCGCRGSALGATLRGSGHAVRGTTRDVRRLGELERTGIEGVVADPDRLATLVPALSNVSAVCWLMGTAAGAPDLHAARLQTLLEHLVDTHVRGFVYEAAGTLAPAALSEGASFVRTASRTWRIRCEIVEADPASHDDWLAAMAAAVDRVLAP